ncbi:MAG: response regulator [Thiobacillus sp.]|nr:response regulator [Thiobacillus sp.]
MPKDARHGDLILLVDDSRDQISMLTNALEREDLMPVAASSGEAALSMLDQVVPQLIVMDAIMPGMDGFETCRQLKNEKRFAHVPVIFMTGLKDTEHVLKGFEAGGVDYVTKPVRLEELMARIRIHIANARVAMGACSALDVTGRYLIATDVLGDARWCTPQAGELLSLSFPGVQAADVELPTGIAEQFRRLIAAGEVKRTDTIGAEARPQMIVTYLGESGPDEHLFSLTADSGVSDAQMLSKAYGLTSREAEVLIWIARGKSNREISEILLISPRTVNKHLERVFTKLGVENRAAAASTALRALTP